MANLLPSLEVSACPAEARFPEAYRLLRQAIAERALPCCAFGVLASGRVLVADALGRFTWEPSEAAPTAETRFDIASLTKVVGPTAAAMLLYQRQRLDLDQPLGELLPEFVAGRASGDPARRIRLRHLLAHSSGLPAHREFFRTATDAPELWSQLFQTPLEAEPGTRAEYSDLGFLLLGRALETISGENLASWTQRELFAPLGMTATGFCPAAALHPLIPPTEIDDSTGRQIQGEVQDENARLLGGVAAHAGLFSNIPDLLRFAGAILAARQPGNQPTLFSPATLELFARRQPPAGSSRALGWDTPSGNSSSGHHFSPRSIGHLGFSGCSLWIDLEADLAIVLLTNRTWPDRQNQAIRTLRPAFHDAVRLALTG